MKILKKAKDLINAFFGDNTNPNPTPRNVSQIKDIQSNTEEYTSYFKNGVLFRVLPNRNINNSDYKEIAYHSRYIVSDGIKYDLKNVESINGIKTPTFPKERPKAIKCLEYILKRILPTGNDEIDIAIMSKLIVLMKASCFTYTKKDFYDLPKKYYEMGEFDKGDLALNKIKEYLPEVFDDEYINKTKLNRALLQAKNDYNNDLVEIASQYTTCKECNILQGRVYSAYGWDKRFPILPQEIMQGKRICEYCGIEFLPFLYFEGAKIYVYDSKDNRVEKDAIKHSNRAYRDNRSAAAKERYEKIKSELSSDKNYIENYKNFCADKFNSPESTPKSFSAYMRKLNK